MNPATTSTPTSTILTPSSENKKKKKKKNRISKSERKRRKRQRELEELLHTPTLDSSSPSSSLFKDSTTCHITTTVNDHKVDIHSSITNTSKPIHTQLATPKQKPTLGLNAQVNPPSTYSTVETSNINHQTTSTIQNTTTVYNDEPENSIPITSSSSSIKKNQQQQQQQTMECYSPFTQKLFVRDIQFVYPKTINMNSTAALLLSSTTPSTVMKPYTFTLLRQEEEVEDNNLNRTNNSQAILKKTKDVVDGYDCTPTIDESMDDIFDIKRRKRNVEQEEKERQCHDNNISSSSQATKTLNSSIVSSTSSMLSQRGRMTIQQQAETKANSSNTELDSSSSDDSELFTHIKNNASSSIVLQSSKDIQKISSKDDNKQQPQRQLISQQQNVMKLQKQKMNDDGMTNSLKEENQQPQRQLVSQQQDSTIRQPQDMEDHHHHHHRPLSGRTLQDVIRDTMGKRPRSNSTDGVLNLPQCGLCDEIRVLESYQWKKNTCKKGDSIIGVTGQQAITCGQLNHPRGLINLGNTCFLNATLQCLAYLPTFCQCLISLPNLSTSPSSSHVQSNQPGHKTSSLSPGKKITLYMQTILEKMHGISSPNENGSMTTNNTLGPLAPKVLYHAIPSLSGSGRGYTFRPGRQEDAHEFLIHLLDTMQNGELQAAGINPKASGWRDRLPIPRLDETTFIHRVFGGYLRSQITCPSCGYKSNTYDPFLDLALEVNQSSSLMSALSQFMKRETLDSANKWKCSGCSKHVCATKQLTVFRPPLSLVVQLKRFVYGGQGMLLPHKNGFHNKFLKNAATRSKIQKPIDFSTVLELPLSDGRRCEYYLTGIIIHEGSSANSGHYTACVRKPNFDHNRDEWYHMDDGSVSKVSENSVLQQKNAYVLFYTRKEVKLELPRPPSRSFVDAEEAKKVVSARSKARVDSLVSLEDGKIVHGIDHQMVIASMNRGFKEMGETASILKNASISSLTLTPRDNKIADTFAGETKSTSKPTTDSAHNQTFKLGMQQMAHHEGKTKTKAARKSIKINRGIDSVEVFLHDGKKANLWTFNDQSKDLAEGSLLGNRPVSTWEQEDNDGKVTTHNQNLVDKRDLALNELRSQSKSRKRKMFLDTWDANLDAGKVKKVKNRMQNKPSPSQNPFQIMQQMKMNKKKGFFAKKY